MRVIDNFSVWFSGAPTGASSYYIYKGLALGLTK